MRYGERQPGAGEEDGAARGRPRAPRPRHLTPGLRLAATAVLILLGLALGFALVLLAQELLTGNPVLTVRVVHSGWIEER